MTDKERDGYIVGCYRRLGKLIDLLKAGGRADAKAEPEPMEQTLPGFATNDWTPPEIEAKPREWCNTVKVYEAIWKHFGKDGRPFGLADLCRTEGFLADVSDATKNRVAPTSLSKMLSVTTRAEATYTIRKGVYRCCEPTDELREAIERTAKKRTAAKEVSA